MKPSYETFSYIFLMARSQQFRVGRGLATVVLAATAPAIAQVPSPDLLHTDIECRADPSQTYTLYLPSSASTDNPRPALLILDPRGRSVGAATRFKPAADRFGWILLSSDNTRSDGPMEPNHRALAALWSELNNNRWPIDRRRIYAAGFSGGAHFSWMLGKRTNGLSGVIACGGRHLPDLIAGTTFSHFGATGTTDFNNRGMRLVDEQLAEQGNAHRLAIFDGGHQWMPADLALLAVSWMEIDAMKKGLRERDDALIDRMMSNDLESARSLAAQGLLLEAQRRYSAAADTYRGLGDVAAVQKRADELLKQPEVRRDLKEERRLAAYEKHSVTRMFNACAALRDSDRPYPAGRFENELQIKQLEKMAETESVEGVTARRILATVFTQTSFYLTQELMADGAYDKAAVALAAATRIDPKDPTVWYNLACAQALGGNAGKALDSLQTAIEAGFSDLQRLTHDPDLSSLHDCDRFDRLVASVIP